MKKQSFVFIIRWLVNAAALWFCAQVIHVIAHQDIVWGYFIGGFILALLNAVVKPILVIVTLPAIAWSLGVFLVVVNGVVVYLASLIYHPMQINTFWAAVLVGIVIGLVNYIVTITAGAIKENNA